MRRFLEKVTGFSRAQLNRLIAQHRRTGHIRDHRSKPPANAFARRYTDLDAASSPRSTRPSDSSPAPRPR